MSQEEQISFEVDGKNLYREESLTDLRVAVIRKLIPVTPDGLEDKTRKPLFFGHSQVMSPEGPIPLQAQLDADNMEDAMKEFPRAMSQAMDEMIDHIRMLQKEQQQQQESRIITPGR